MSELEIVAKDKLTEEDKASLFGWGNDLWGNDRYRLTWRRPDIKFVGYQEGTPFTQAVWKDRPLVLGSLPW